MLSQEALGSDEDEYIIGDGSLTVYEFTNDILHTES